MYLTFHSNLNLLLYPPRLFVTTSLSYFLFPFFSRLFPSFPFLTNFLPRSTLLFLLFFLFFAFWLSPLGALNFFAPSSFHSLFFSHITSHFHFLLTKKLPHKLLSNFPSLLHRIAKKSVLISYVLCYSLNLRRKKKLCCELFVSKTSDSTARESDS